MGECPAALALGVDRDAPACEASVLFVEDAIARLARNLGDRYAADDERERRSFARANVLVALPPLERPRLLAARYAAADAPGIAWLRMDDAHKLVLAGEAPEGARFGLVLLVGLVELAFGAPAQAAALLRWAASRARAGGAVAGLTLCGGVLEHRYRSALQSAAGGGFAKNGGGGVGGAWSIDQPRDGAREPVLALRFDAWRPRAAPGEPACVFARGLRVAWGAHAADADAARPRAFAVGRDALVALAAAEGLAPARDFHGLQPVLRWNAQARVGLNEDKVQSIERQGPGFPLPRCAICAQPLTDPVYKPVHCDHWVHLNCAQDLVWRANGLPSAVECPVCGARTYGNDVFGAAPAPPADPRKRTRGAGAAAGAGADMRPPPSHMRDRGARDPFAAGGGAWSAAGAEPGGERTRDAEVLVNMVATADPVDRMRRINDIRDALIDAVRIASEDHSPERARWANLNALLAVLDSTNVLTQDEKERVAAAAIASGASSAVYDHVRSVIDEPYYTRL